MKQYYKDKAPKWTNEINEKRDLIFGTDSDNSISCNLLEDITSGKWKPNYYFDFENLYGIENTGNKSIGVDMAFRKNFPCFDNHLSQQYNNSEYNPNCFNLNLYKGITADKSYHKKFPFSTLMLIMAYYDIPLPKTQLGKEIILAVDSSFKGHYASNSFFKNIHTEWLELMGFSELYDILEQRSKSYFSGLQEEFLLNEKIHINENGYLETNIDVKAIQPYLDWKLYIPDQQFELYKECKLGYINDIKKERLPDNVISLAYTSKDRASFTYL
ncbi:hypothetical protein ACIQ4I_15395 [Rummeliibacillus sp. NPDC094406]|uniref:hypothetical protein n=1 Tax=Rummeliibacillus sp. NPDC094406 TaxID=3364511 RepID=UPI00380E4172